VLTELSSRHNIFSPSHIFTRDSHTTESPWHGEETLHRILGKICTFRSANRRLNSGRITLPRVRSRAQALDRALATLCARAAHGRRLSHATQPCPRAPISTSGAQQSTLHFASRPEQKLQLRRALHRPPSLPKHGHRGQPFPTTPSLALAPGRLPREAVKLSRA
jgi:hypothetical protein